MALAANADRDSARLIARRWELYHSAASLFENNGFRGVTVDALARACLLSPASLYHYFPSKASFALFPLTTRGGLCQDWHRLQISLPVTDPLFQVHAIIAFVATFEPEVE